jgi:hypothetical protein
MLNFKIWSNFFEVSKIYINVNDPRDFPEKAQVHHHNQDPCTLFSRWTNSQPQPDFMLNLNLIYK